MLIGTREAGFEQCNIEGEHPHHLLKGQTASDCWYSLVVFVVTFIKLFVLQNQVPLTVECRV